MCMFSISINKNIFSLKKPLLETIIGPNRHFSVFTLCRALCWRWVEWGRTRNKIDMTPDLAELAVYPLTGEQVIAAEWSSARERQVWEVKESNPCHRYLKVVVEEFN